MQSESENRAVHEDMPRSSMSDVDMRCAAVFARVALQALSDLNPEAASAIGHALGHELRMVRAENTAESADVAAIIADMRARLAGEDSPSELSEESVWYIE